MAIIRVTFAIFLAEECSVCEVDCLLLNTLWTQEIALPATLQDQ